MATVAWRDCLQGKAKDLDGNGLLNIEEITSCAQRQVDLKLRQFPDVLGQHMTIGGNKAFIPSYQVASTASAPVAAAIPAIPATPPATAPAAVAVEAPAAETGFVAKSPMVGTFYRAPNPESPSFVNVGDTVKVGQTLCIIEAMKLLNEIESEKAGVIKEILCENGQGVEFDQPLFVIV